MSDIALPIYYPERCTGCGLCLAVCPQGVLALVSGRAAFAAPDKCVYCGECELACPAEAVELYFEIVDGPATPAASEHIEGVT